MIENLTVGPPLKGFPGPAPLKEAAKEPREDSTGSFSRTLGERMNTRTESPPRSNPRTRAKEAGEGPPEAAPPKAAPPGPVRELGAREKAIRKFMDSFESEFGIPPTEIVEAMASIEPQKMNEAPEATLEDVIGNLDLSEEDREKAMAMYAGLLVELQATPIPAAPSFATAPTALIPQQVNERVSLAQERRAELGRSLEQLNQKFWMSGMRSSPGMPAVETTAFRAMSDPENLAFAEEADLSVDSDLMADDAGFSPLMEAPFDAELSVPTGPTMPAGDGKAATDPMKKVLAEMKRAADQARIERVLAQSAPPVPRADGALAAGSPQAMMFSATADAATMEAPGPMMAVPSAEARDFGAFDGNGESKSGMGGDSKETSTTLKANAETMMSPTPLKMEDVAAALKAAPPSAAMMMTPADNEANVQQLMTQAQYLVKKGGGEVKVEMSPEGLGRVNLKILLQDGKVNVQMATESHEAKKLIEGSLGELRSSLAAQKLSVDHVKVDVVSGPSTDSQARNDTSQNPNSDQRQTRQFWNQFQDSFGNRGARDGLWDVPGLKQYRSNRQTDPLAPIDEARAASRTERGDGRGKGLNLVA